MGEEHQGFTNWDTWHCKLLIDNEAESHYAAEQLVEQGLRAGWSEQQLVQAFEEWAVRTIVGPHNQKAIQDAQEWNDIPEDERIDYHYEDFKEKHPEAMDLIHGLVGGPDVGDTDPVLMQNINFQEIVDRIKDDILENWRYEQNENAGWQGNESVPEWWPKPETLTLPEGWGTTSAIKLGYPPADEAPAFRDEYRQTPSPEILPMQRMDDFGAPTRGYDWEINWPAVHRLQAMPTWPLKGVSIRMQPPGYHEHDLDRSLWTDARGSHIGYGNSHEISLHPLQSMEDANESLWHELQHAYQLEEGRMDMKNYDSGNLYNPEKYLEHPIETDAREFARQMKSEPLIKKADPMYHPSWIPESVHEDLGDFDPETMENRLPENIAFPFLQQQVQWFRTNPSYWRNMGWVDPEASAYDPYEEDFYDEPDEHFARKMSSDDVWGTLLNEGFDEHPWQYRRPFVVDFSNPDDPNPPIWIGNPGEFHDHCPTGAYRPFSYRGEIWEHVSPPLIQNAGNEDPIYDPKAKAQAERAYHQMQGTNERTSMAERTGNPEIDKLIEDFLREEVREYGDGSIVDALRHPENSHGMCQAITEQFVEFARERGFKAYATDTDIDEMGYTPTGEGGEIGFNENDEMEYGFYPEHTVASIYLDESRFPIIIDFTASQYGYTDHPKVSKTASDGDDWMTSQNDSWYSPSNDSLYQVDVPGEAPGMPRNMGTGFKKPCWCDNEQTIPHEWSPLCGQGQRTANDYGEWNNFLNNESQQAPRDFPDHGEDYIFNVHKLGLPEWDGRAGRYPYIHDDNNVWIGPEGGSHMMIERNFPESNSGPNMGYAYGEIFHRPPGTPWVNQYWGGNPDTEQRVLEAYNSGQRMPGGWQDWMERLRRTPELPDMHREAAERAIVLFHGTTNKGWEVAQQQGGISARDYMKAAQDVAAHYGVDPEELHNHEWNSFTRTRTRNDVFLTSSRTAAEHYAQDRSEVTTDLLRTVFRMTQMPVDENGEAVGEYPGYRNPEFQQFRAEYFAAQNLQPVLLTLNVPLAALNDSAQRMLAAGYTDIGDTTLKGPVPLEWVISVEELPDDPSAPFKQWFSKQATDMIPSGQMHVLPLKPKPNTSWDDEGQWDTDTFLDHDIINQHLKSQGQADQYQDYLTREQRAKDAEWPTIGIKEAKVVDLPGEWKDHGPGAPGERTFIYVKPTDTLYLAPNNAYHQDIFDWLYQNDPQMYGELFHFQGVDDKGQPYDFVSNQRMDLSKLALGFLRHDYPDQAMVVEMYWAEGENRLPDHIAFELENHIGERVYQRDWKYPPTPQQYNDDSYWESQFDPYHEEPTAQWPTNAQEPIDHFGKVAADNAPGMPVEDSGHWAWLDGKVGFGGSHSDIVERLARELGYDDYSTKYISNWVARGHCPQDHAIALGTMKGKYPQIYNSTRDRNHIWDAVMRAREATPST